MKRYTKFLYSFRAAAIGLLAAAGLAACEADPVLQDEGQLPAASDTPTGALISTVKNAPGEISLALQYDDSKESGHEISDAFAFMLTEAADHDITVRFRVDTIAALNYNDDRGLINSYNFLDGIWKTYQRYRPVLPKYTTLPEPAEVTIPAGKTSTGTIPIKFNFDVVDPAFEQPSDNQTAAAMPLRKFGRWICPVVAEVIENGVVTKTSETLYYKIDVLKDICNWWKHGDERRQRDDICQLFIYCNTSAISPLIANIMKVEVTDLETFEGDAYYAVDAVMLQTATVTYDARQQRAVLKIAPDLHYVLLNRTKYIVPLKTIGAKVCIAIQGGGEGIGFCNLNDAQRNDLATQIASVVTMYKLDGVNLWDGDSGYGAEGMPAADPASYAKFIKVLREKLGPDKLLSLVDDGVCTAGFDKTIDGIEVGRLIDYAWSDQRWQPVSPWDATYSGGLKPIAGLDKTKWSCMFFDWSSNYNPMEDTETWGEDMFAGSKWYPITHDLMEPAGKFVVACDIMASQHGGREGEPCRTLELLQNVYSIKMDMEAFTGTMAVFSNMDKSLTDDGWGSGQHSDGIKDW